MIKLGQVIFSLTAPSLHLRLKFEFSPSDAIFMKFRRLDSTIHLLLFIMKYAGNFSGGVMQFCKDLDSIYS